MFDDYAKKLEKLEADVPKIFSSITTFGARYFEKSARKQTTDKGAVDTGYYRRSWLAETVKKKPDFYAIKCMNTAEYASFLEDGYEIKQRYFVPFDKMQGSPKSQRIIEAMRAKNPKSKGFMAKPRKVKGLKIGRYATDDTHAEIVLKLMEEVKIAMTQKKTGASREEIKKYLK